jgi:IS30 family transposase
MENKYTQLDIDELCELSSLRKVGCSFREIERIMGCSHSTIAREFKRNGLSGGRYKLDRASIMAQVQRDRRCKNCSASATCKSMFTTTLRCDGRQNRPPSGSGNSNHATPFITRPSIATWTL